MTSSIAKQPRTDLAPMPSTLAEALADPIHASVRIAQHFGGPEAGTRARSFRAHSVARLEKRYGLSQEEAFGLNGKHSRLVRGIDLPGWTCERRLEVHAASGSGIAYRLVRLGDGEIFYPVVRNVFGVPCIVTYLTEGMVERNKSALVTSGNTGSSGSIRRAKKRKQQQAKWHADYEDGGPRANRRPRREPSVRDYLDDFE